MAITLTAAAQNAACDAVVDLIDAGSTDASGDLVYQTAGDAEVATCVMSNPAFGAASAGTATANAITDDTNATGGTTTKFSMQDRDNTEVYEGSVTGTGGGGDIELSGGTVIGAGSTVSTSSLTHTQPAS